MRIGIGTGRFIYTSLLTFDITFVFYDDIAIGSCRYRRWTTSLRRRITTLRWRRTTSKYRRSDRRPTLRSENVDESMTGSAFDWHR